MGRSIADVFDFQPEGGYAESFGDQWSRFARTQLDSANGTTISRERFRAVTGWSAEDITGRRVLDAGCGAGRFSDVALSDGALVTAMDLSAAVYTARQNLGFAPSLTTVRGSILEPPLQDEAFDLVFSIGVLQHTPDPLAAARRLLRLVRPGGQLALWVYERRWYTGLQPKALLRHLSKRMSRARVRSLVNILVSLLTPLARIIGHLPPRYRRVIKGFLPIASYWGELPLNAVQQREWAMLDTVDWLTPTYDEPQTFEALRDALLQSGATSIRRIDVGGVAVVARRAG